jgi:hypothetical protein
MKWIWKVSITKSEKKKVEIGKFLHLVLSV